MSSLSHRFSHYNRHKKLRYINDFIRKRSIQNCLIVGSMPRGSESFWENIIELGLLETFGQNLVFSGLENSGGAWPNWIQADGRHLPFKNLTFDLVISNAVIEHVGSLEDQKNFVKEHIRCGRNWIITTPNRFFPIESHTQILFKHFSRNWSYRNLRLLSKNELRSILPKDSKIRGFSYSPTFIAHNT